MVQGARLARLFSAQERPRPGAERVAEWVSDLEHV